MLCVLLALSPMKKIFLIRVWQEVNIVLINIIIKKKESYPASDARGTISAMRFRPEKGDVIFADSQGTARGFHV